MSTKERLLRELEFFFAFLLLTLFLVFEVEAEQSLSGPTISIQTDGSRTDDDINVGTQNSGVINFFVGNNKKLTISSSGLSGSALTGLTPILTNNTFLTAVDAAGTGTVNLIKGSASDNTVIASASGKVVALLIENDNNRSYNFNATSDTAFNLTWGDSGSTALQVLTVAPSTADADDDATLQLGFASGLRGAGITLPGEEVSGGSDITYNAGTGDTHIFNVAGTNEVVISNDTIKFGVVTGGTALIGTSSNATTDDNNLVLTAASQFLSNGADGATIVLRGNEVSSTGGTVNIYAGNASTANLNFFIEDTASKFNFRDITTGILASIEDDGDIVLDATNGGNIVQAKAATGVFLGEATPDADVITQTIANPRLFINDNAATEYQMALIQSGNNATPGSIGLFKTRAAGASSNANTIAQSADDIFIFRFLASDGALYRQAATIRGQVDGTPGSNDMPGAIIFATKPDNTTTTLDRLKITNAGDVATDATNGGNLKIMTPGKGLQVAEGSNATMGTSTCNGASTVTVSTTAVTANSRIFYSFQAVGGTPLGVVYTFARTAGTSFGFRCAATDTSTVAWWLVEPAA